MFSKAALARERQEVKSQSLQLSEDMKKIAQAESELSKKKKSLEALETAHKVCIAQVKCQVSFCRTKKGSAPKIYGKLWKNLIRRTIHYFPVAQTWRISEMNYKQNEPN